MININEHFDTSSMSDVAYHALKTFAENDLDISYLNEVNQELKKLVTSTALSLHKNVN